MCSVSAVHDYFRQHTAPIQWSPQSFQDFKEIIHRLEILDEKLGQRDCVDPAKAAWVKDVEARLKRLEKKTGSTEE